MREWLWQHKMIAIPLMIVLMAMVSVLVYAASGNAWTYGIFSTLFNLLWWGGLSYLFARESRKRKAALEERGIFLYLRYPGSRPGSLHDIWAGGTVSCEPHRILFQEVMSGTEVSLGQPAVLEVIKVSDSPKPLAGSNARHLPPGLKVLTLILPHGSVEVAADQAALEKLQQQVLHDG
ncbi:hypothetical protein [Arthrobacter sp. lap29]|uniref:hypothetical protein n=1 Tax=Arthrobacter sp. lap29 TaxID=3056122 RepID=UPI0028F7255D|nr:hypothetical protein [Arthrobacter sp. lap29]